MVTNYTVQYSQDGRNWKEYQHGCVTRVLILIFKDIFTNRLLTTYVIIYKGSHSKLLLRLKYCLVNVKSFVFPVFIKFSFYTGTSKIITKSALDATRLRSKALIESVPDKFNYPFIYEPLHRIQCNQQNAWAKTKAQFSFAVTAKLISASDSTILLLFKSKISSS